MVLEGAACVCQLHRAVLYFHLSHGSWSEGLCWGSHLHRVGKEAAPYSAQRRRQSCGRVNLLGGSVHFQALPRSLWPCPDFSLTSSSCRKMRSSEKYLRLYVQSKYWKGSGLKFRCSLEGIPSFSAHSWYRYFLLEMSCAFH